MLTVVEYRWVISWVSYVPFLFANSLETVKIKRWRKLIEWQRKNGVRGVGFPSWMVFFRLILNHFLPHFFWSESGKFFPIVLLVRYSSFLKTWAFRQPIKDLWFLLPALRFPLCLIWTSSSVCWTLSSHQTLPWLLWQQRCSSGRTEGWRSLYS